MSAEAAAADTAAEQQEEHQAETEDDSDHDAATDTTEDESHTGNGAAKKKKKKKKKKKAAGEVSGGGADSEQAGSSTATAAAEKLTAAEKQELNRRFQKAIDSAKQGEDMWVLLGGANLHDAKVKKLFEALRSNSSITSVNLSSNHFGDEGVQALVDVLQQGGCSELISLDLRDNSLSPEAEALLAGLSTTRKQLDIATGPLPPPQPEAGSSSGGGRHKGGRGRGGRGSTAGRGAGSQLQQQQQQQGQQQQPQRPRGPEAFQELVRTSPMFRRYFQTGEEDDADGSSGDEEVEAAEQLPPPEEVWEEVEQLLPKGVSSIPQLSSALVIISRALDSEMAAMPAREDNAQLDDFQPHFRAVVQHLPQLQQILQLQPPPKVHQSSSATPQPAVGSHRVWACGILHMLLLHNNSVIDQAIADAGLLPTVMALSFQHAHCSAVQCRAVEMLRSSLRSNVQQLWRGLFTAGYGQQVQQPGSSELVPPLHEALVQIAEGAVKQPMGKRPCSTGFAVEVANTLLQGSDADNPEQQCAELAALLDSCAVWKDSIAPEGAINTLLQEQDGQLCGPPPVRPAPSMDSMDDDPLNGLMLNGQLFALLNQMQPEALMQQQ